MMNDSSYTHKLYLVTGLIILSMASLILSAYWLNTQFTQLLNASEKTEVLNSNLLSLRRHEKDFMLRHQDKYLDKHQQAMDTIINNLSALKIHLIDIDFSSKKLAAVKSSLLEYQLAFHRFAKLLQKKSNLLKTIEKRSSDISNALQTQPDARLVFYKLSDAIRYDLLQPQFRAQQSVADFEQLKSLLIKALPDEGLELFFKYEDLIYQLFKLEVSLGIDENKGAEGELRTKIHFSEAMLSQISTAIEHHIASKIKYWWKSELMWALILLTISLILLINIIRKHAVPHKAAQ